MKSASHQHDAGGSVAGTFPYGLEPCTRPWGTHPARSPVALPSGHATPSRPSCPGPEPRPRPPRNRSSTWRGEVPHAARPWAAARWCSMARASATAPSSGVRRRLRGLQARASPEAVLAAAGLKRIHMVLMAPSTPPNSGKIPAGIEGRTPAESSSIQSRPLPAWVKWRRSKALGGRRHPSIECGCRAPAPRCW